MDVIGYTLSKRYAEKIMRKRRIPVSIPSGFLWSDNPLNGKIYTDGFGTFWSEDFDISDYKYSGKTYYVDINNGNNSNDGLTPNTALRFINAAVAKSDVGVIMVAEGVYHRDAGFAGLLTTKNLSVIAMPGAKVQVTTHTPLTWTLTNGKSHTYQANRSDAYAVCDSSIIDINGDYQTLIEVGSSDEVEGNPGSWFTDGTLVYVHTPDVRSPDNDIRVYRTQNNVYLSGGPTFYADGIDFEGGANGCIRSGPNSKVFARNCSFKYADGNGGVQIVGSDIVIFEECLASKNLSDGFNYHAGSGVVPKFVEIGCVARDNGSSNNDNGSTSHDGVYGIRLNCANYRNFGPNIADVSDGTQTWNLGCVSFESHSIGNQGSDFQLSQGTAWYDSCIGYGSVYAIAVGSGGIANIRNGNFPTELVSGGTKQFY